MDTLDNRVQRVQARRKKLLIRQKRIRNTGLFLFSAALLGSLLYFIGRQTELHRPIATDSAAASSLLDSSAGGYVLVAVLAFCLGVMVTLFCRGFVNKKRRNNKSENGGQQDD